MKHLGWRCHCVQLAMPCPSRVFIQHLGRDLVTSKRYAAIGVNLLGNSLAVVSEGSSRVTEPEEGI